MLVLHQHVCTNRGRRFEVPTAVEIRRGVGRAACFIVDVRYWHLADIPSCAAHVRFRGQSGHRLVRCTCPLLTQSGHRAY